MSNGPIDVRISFPLNILRTNGQNLTKFCKHIKFILTRSRFILLTFIFRIFKISFPLNILRINGQNLTKYCKHIIIDKI